MALPAVRWLHRDGFPHHEIIQGLAGLIGDKFNDGCVIDEAPMRVVNRGSDGPFF